MILRNPQTAADSSSNPSSSAADDAAHREQPTPDNQPLSSDDHRYLAAAHLRRCCQEQARRMIGGGEAKAAASIVAHPAQYADAPLYYGRHETPFGSCLLLLRGDALARVTFGEFVPPEGAVHAPQRTVAIWRALFEEQQNSAALPPLLLPGSAFQQAVWRGLMRIPPGGVLDYGSLAQLVGAPRAARAVGQCAARNPLAWVVPCHRLIRRDGDIGHYYSGKRCKRAMLIWEARRYGAH